MTLPFRLANDLNFQPNLSIKMKMKVTFGVYILIALNLALDATEMSASRVFSFSEETYLKTSGN